MESISVQIWNFAGSNIVNLFFIFVFFSYLKGNINCVNDMRSFLIHSKLNIDYEKALAAKKPPSILMCVSFLRNFAKYLQLTNLFLIDYFSIKLSHSKNSNTIMKFY